MLMEWKIVVMKQAVEYSFASYLVTVRVCGKYVLPAIWSPLIRVCV